MLAFLLWGILFVIIFAFMCCIMPWWLVLLVIVSGFFCSFIPSFDSVFTKPKKKLKKIKNQGKASVVNPTKGTVMGGSTAHRTLNTDYDNYIAAKREEQAAYDDFIASMDMADD